MIKVEKKHNKKLPVIIAASAVLALSVIAMILLFLLIPGEEQQTQPQSSVDYMYNETSSSDILGFSVDGDNGYFSARRPSKDSGIFLYYYKDDDGVEQVYFPEICYTEPRFDYTSLYAQTDDGLNVQKLTYVLATLASPLYSEKIELQRGDAGYGEALSVYGLDSAQRESITFTCIEKRVVEVKDEDGNIMGAEKEVEVERTIYIGNRLVTGVGYYVQVEEKINGHTEYQPKTDPSDAEKYVYICPSAENFKYALEGFNSFVTPRLIMQGNQQLGDSVMEPYLTTNYKQWTNTVYKDGQVTAGSNVVFKADLLTSIYSAEEDTDPVHKDGYVHSGYLSYQVDLADLAKRDIFKRFVNMMVGADVKEYDKDLLATLILDTNKVDIKDGTSAEYSYKITEIESILTDGGELTEGAVGDNKLIKVKYTFKGGESSDWMDIFYGEPQHAIIDLDDDRIPTDVREYLSASSVGAVDSAKASFTFTYNEDNSNSSRAEYVITDITGIKEERDDVLVDVNKITEKSIVFYNYKIYSDGEVVDEGSDSVQLALITDESDEDDLKLKTALVGRSIAADANITVYDHTEYYQMFMNFRTYSIKEIEFYVERELVSSYRFVNPSDRNLFYGENIHESTLPVSNPYSNYPLDASSCDYVARVLGGMPMGSASNVFEGLLGSEVVDVGLTPDNMREYGLYAYTIYFEIPRGVEENDSGDYDVVESRGFTLYIGERQEDGTRYVGSDMYSLIVKMDADILYWVEEDFIDFWARRNMVMVDHTNVDRITADINLKDFYGTYVFDISHPEAWINSNSELVFSLKEGEEANPYKALWVYASVKGEHSSTVLSKHLADLGKDEVRIADIYALVLTGNPNADIYMKYDEVGDANLKSLLNMLYSVTYVGTLTDEEIAEATAKEPVLSLSFYVAKSVGSTAYEYGFDFYYTADGAVAVSLYKHNTLTGERTEESCHFYISNLAFKKIIYSFSDLVNGAILDQDEGFRG